MLVRIAKRELRRGMYVEAVECAHDAFDRRRFIVDSEDVLKKIMASPADFVLINQRVGAPVEHAAPVAPSAEMAAEVGRVGDALCRSFASVGRGDLDAADLEELTDDLLDIVNDAPAAFFQLTRLQLADHATYQHSIAVSGLMMKLASLFELEDETIRQLGVAGLLHDIGKLTIPAAILNKAGPLSEVERQLVRTHPERGFRILRRQGSFSQLVLDVTRHHHELLDGSGYPNGLTDREIVLPVRIATVCDVLDALTSVRAYKRAWETSEALRWLFERPHHFDARLTLKLASFL